MGSSFSGSTNSSSSPLNGGKSKRGSQKMANAPSTLRETTTKSVYLTKAVGNVLPNAVNPETENADFYRNGKWGVSSGGSELEQKTYGYVVPPRDFRPFDSKNKAPSSIRVWGRVKPPPKEAAQKKQATFGNLIPAYTKFILEGVQESRVERSQIIETFGDFYVFMFGERPPVFQFSGHLINAQYTNWVNDFNFMYERYLRGTKCVESNATSLITYAGRQVEGLILNMSTQINAAIEGAVPVQFSVVVFDRRSFVFSEDMGYTSEDNINLNKDEQLIKILSEIAGEEGKNMARPEESLSNQIARGVFNKGEPCSGVNSYGNYG